MGFALKTKKEKSINLKKDIEKGGGRGKCLNGLSVCVSVLVVIL